MDDADTAARVVADDAGREDNDPIAVLEQLIARLVRIKAALEEAKRHYGTPQGVGALQRAQEELDQIEADEAGEG